MATGKILVVDDNKAVGKLVEIFLKILFPGVEVIYEDNPNDVYTDLMLGSKFDLVITDFIMPEVDGAQIMIAAMVCDIPVLGMSADINDFQERVSIALEKGDLLPRRIDFIKKPFELKEFKCAVDQLFAV